MEAPRPTKRRWFRFSLRTMFVLVTLFAVLFSTVALVFRQATRGLITESEGLGIRKGTTAMEVERRLGPPKQVTRRAHGSTWLYSCGFAKFDAWLAIEFDEHDIVISVHSWI
jgi:hypothetical protein